MGAAVVARDQLCRLFQILIALRSHAAPNAEVLARVCEVSRRTVYRDLATLFQAGVPVRFRPERRGYELAPEFRFETPRLDEREAMALIVSVAASNDLEALGLSREARAALGKLLLGLPEGTRWWLVDLLERVGTADEAGLIEADQRTVFETLIHALIRRRQVRVQLDSPGDADFGQTTRLSPYRLLRVRSRWTIVGRSSLHRAVRTFPLARLQRAWLTEDEYELPPRFQCPPPPQPRSKSASTPVRLRFAAPVASLAREQFRGSGVVASRRDDGRLELQIAGADPEAVFELVLSFGEFVEVLDPPELRERLLTTARRVIMNHVPMNVVPPDSISQRA